jgi:hypothetical protein
MRIPLFWGPGVFPRSGMFPLRQAAVRQSPRRMVGNSEVGPASESLVIRPQSQGVAQLLLDSLQLRVLCLSFFQDRDVGIGVFP